MKFEDEGIPSPHPMVAPIRFELMPSPNVNLVECSTVLNYGALYTLYSYIYIYFI